MKKKQHKDEINDDGLLILETMKINNELLNGSGSIITKTTTNFFEQVFYGLRNANCFQRKKTETITKDNLFPFNCLFYILIN